MAARWRGEGGQHQGARPYQEDTWSLKELADGGVLAVVSDGMGGHAGGAVASKAAVAAFMKTVADGGKPLADGLAAANEAVRVAGVEKPHLAGLGATLVGVVVKGNEVRWISVGDSPFFMADGATLVRLNADHSMAPQIDALVERGVISPEEAAQHPARHTLREAVMGEPLSLIDEGKRDLPAGAKLLLCSDGVQTLSDKDLLARAKRPVKAIVNAVLAARRKHQDNVTVVLLERES
jgi:serine/threonine protein phosphatase PrpC